MQINKSNLCNIYGAINKGMLIVCIPFVLASCSQSKNSFSKEDIAAQQAFISLVGITHNKIDKTSLIDSIKMLKLPDKEQTIKVYEDGEYIDKIIKLSEEDRHIHMYRKVIDLINVSERKCFLPVSDLKFNTEDFAFNIAPCLGGLYAKIEDQLQTKFPKKSLINYQFFEEVNNLLSVHGSEMGLVQLYDDSYYFIFFEKRNKKKVYSIFDNLGIQIGDHSTLFRGYESNQ